MRTTNTTYITDLNNWEFSQLIEEGKKALEKYPVVKNNDFVFVKVNGEPIDAGEFDIGSKFGEGIAVASLKSGDSRITPLEGKLDIRRYAKRFGRRYTSQQNQFKLLIPEGRDLIYIAQELSRDKLFIQWANHTHTQKTQEIMEKADYALFQIANSPVIPLAALISGLDILLLGDALIGSTGYYKEICIAGDKTRK